MDPRATATRPMATPAVRVEKNLATVRPVYPARQASTRHQRANCRTPAEDPPSLHP